MRKKTLRKMLPQARRVDKFSGEALSLGRRLAHLCEDIWDLEIERNALKSALDHAMTKSGPPEDC